MDLNGIRSLPTGNVIDLNDVSEYEFTVEEIALLLSKVKRFNGWGTDVANHSLYVAKFLYFLTGNPHIALLGLLHDAHEAYIGDIATPVKHLLGKQVKSLEHCLQRAILWRLNAMDELSFGSVPLIKLIDLIAMREELDAMASDRGYKIDDKGVWTEALRIVEPFSVGVMPRFSLYGDSQIDFIRYYDYMVSQCKHTDNEYKAEEVEILGVKTKLMVCNTCIFHSFLTSNIGEQNE